MDPAKANPAVLRATESDGERAFVRTFVRSYVRSFIRTYVRACVRSFVRARASEKWLI